jgi:UDP-N-acetylmuramate dehydrogenase
MQAAVAVRGAVSLQERLQDAGLAVTRDEPLAKRTTFRIGGPADLFAVATTAEQLAAVADLAAQHAAQLTVLGGGSNLLISDAGIRGIVVANQTRWHGPARDWQGPAHALLRPEQWVAESGVLVAGLARATIRAGRSGLEWAVSVPGAVAGAVIGNAGAHGSDTAANLAWALVWRPGRGREVLSREDMRYVYRSSALKEQLLAGDSEAKPVVLAAGFSLPAGNAAEMTAKADEYLARRRATQPVEPSAGSIFRNPPGNFAGKLIEEAGLKGHRIGGAQFSPRHANFIVNTGDASAADVVALINLARRRVWDATALVLSPEILFLGEWATAPLLPL